MPLRDVAEYHRWVERESPSVAAQRTVRAFLAEGATLDVDAEDQVHVWYRHLYATDVVDVIAITNR